jgi:GNAT superfamily N-acetyltransferase
MLVRAAPGDLPTLLEMAARYAVLDRHVFDSATATAGFEPLLESDAHGVVWLLGGRQEPLGYAVVTWGWSVEGGGPEALLDEIFVEEQGRGIGSAAVAEIIEDCRARHMLRIFLETEAHNEAARRLYVRNGFVIEDSVWLSKAL